MPFRCLRNGCLRTPNFSHSVLHFEWEFNTYRLLYNPLTFNAHQIQVKPSTHTSSAKLLKLRGPTQPNILTFARLLKPHGQIQPNKFSFAKLNSTQKKPFLLIPSPSPTRLGPSIRVPRLPTSALATHLPSSSTSCPCSSFLRRGPRSSAQMSKSNLLLAA